MNAGPPSALHIADRICEAKCTFIGASLYIYILNCDDAFATMKATLFPPDQQHHARYGREGRPTPYEVLNYGPMMERLRGNNAFNLEYYRMLLQAPVIQIGDMLARNRYFEKTPELEFYRHLRNALGHGNRYYLINGEPRREAQFQGRKITPRLHGKHAFFGFMGPGDVLELWDWLEAYLRSPQRAGL